MPDDREQGTPYPSADAGPIDEWSKRIYAALRDWPLAETGEWTRWEPGYVLLTINSAGGEAIEPISLYTADEQLTVTFGYWETHRPAMWNSEPDVTAAHGKQLVERWLSGELRTAVLVDAAGKWCGSTLMEAGDLEPQLRAAAKRVRDLHPQVIEVRSPKREDWETYSVEPDWLGI
jgi:hypothetical protein